MVDIAVPAKSDATELAREMGDPSTTPWTSGGSSSRARPGSRPAGRSPPPTANIWWPAWRRRATAIRATRRVADSRLHLAIAAASGSPSLAASIADVQLTLDRLLAAIPVLRRNLDHSDAQHTRIVEAILAGDAAGARAAMEEHCDGTAELLRGLLA